MISTADLLAMQARLGQKQTVSKTGVDKESELHEQIIAYCQSKNIPWLPVHSRMDRAHTQAVGTVDFIIAAENGRTLWVEAKKRGGKLSPAQNATLAWLRRLDHEAYVVTSLEELKDLMARRMPSPPCR